jgi:hypothetical protein
VFEPDDFDYDEVELVATERLVSSMIVKQLSMMQQFDDATIQCQHLQDFLHLSLRLLVDASTHRCSSMERCCWMTTTLVQYRSTDW